MEFIGRQAELSFLEDQYELPHPLILITGRRRVGKSTLIERFVSDKNVFYFEANRERIGVMKQSASKALSRTLGHSIGTFDDWEDLFRAYVESPSEGKKVIVLDEFQYIAMADKDFIKAFQSIWDTCLSKENVMVILCGSHIPMMKKLTKEYDSPMYGRNTGNLQLKPLSFRDTYNGTDYRAAVESYALTGGVPHYMALMKADLSAKENAERLTMSRGASLLEEPTYLMSNEFRDPSSYNTYLRAISEGHRQMSKITSAVQENASAITPYLNNLIKVGMVERRVPIMEENPEHSRNGLYVISDNFTAFWFRFVYPYYNEITRSYTDVAIDELTNHFIDAHVAFVFEEICRSELRNVLRTSGISASYGSHWDRNAEFDVVALDKKRKTIYVGECKYHEKPIDMRVLDKLRKKVVNQREFDGYNIIFCLFSVSGYTDDLMAERDKVDMMLFDNGILLKS